MDGSPFDQFARTLVTRTHRRRILQHMSGGVAAVLAARLGLQGMAAERRTRRTPRLRPERAKQQGRCPAGSTTCRGQCVDLTDNPDHCGACATVCSPGKVCCNGVCIDLLVTPCCTGGCDFGLRPCRDPRCICFTGVNRCLAPL